VTASRLQLVAPAPILPAQALPPDEPHASDVVDEVCATWRESRHELLAGERRKRITDLRRACCVAIRLKCPSLSLQDIGAVLLVDHTTVLHHLQKAGVA
jgi:chromosomal replication initiation ATPase DnaA